MRRKPGGPSLPRTASVPPLPEARPRSPLHRKLPSHCKLIIYPKQHKNLTRSNARIELHDFKGRVPTYASLLVRTTRVVTIYAAATRRAVQLGEQKTAK